MLLSFDQIIDSIKKKNYHPVYFLVGDEPYYIDQVSDLIEKSVLNETEREFDLTVMYGQDTDFQTLIGSARQFPMMSGYHVVILKEAQDMQKLDKCEPYISNPSASTILVINYKAEKLDKRTAFAKVVMDKAAYFESKKIYDDKLPAWIESFIRSKGYSITPKAVAMMAEFLGNDLSKIANEVSKMQINLPAGASITEDIIEQYVGISKDYNIFELQNALGKKDALKVNRIALHFIANEKEFPLVKTIPVLFAFFSKLFIMHQFRQLKSNELAGKLGVSPFFLKDYYQATANYNIPKLFEIVSLLKEYDLRSKGVNNGSADHGELLREMLFRILH